MYGTVARMRAKSGQSQAIVNMLNEWNRVRRPNVKGVVGGYVLIPDDNPDEPVMIAIFQDKDSYVANAQDPQQDQWFQQLRAHLEADPDWTDGEIAED
ncbi:MAG: antibiotic biosynthesis monooxygenase [Candidatus Neomarinimicrobiota bacterium]